MPTNYALRSPLFAKASSSGSSTASAKLLVIVNSVTVYTIIKPAVQNVDAIFEIAELLRDYLNITFTYAPQKLSFVTNIQFFNQPNAGGTAQGSPIQTISGDGWEAYSLYTNGVNSVIPFSNRQRPTWLLADLFPLESVGNQQVIYIPTGKDGKVSWIAYDGTVASANYSTTETFISPTGATRLTIQRIDCTKYGDGRKISFINRYGVLQDLWFFLKRVKSITRSNESYNSNTLTPTATYVQTNAPKKLFNTQAKQMNSLSSGYYPEAANAYFEELLLSEFVWLTRPIVDQPNTEETIPVVVKTSSMSYKTSLNDRLIYYTIDFEDAFDYINNVR